MSVEADTIGEVVVVRNGTGLWRDTEKWRVVEDFRVGSFRVRNPAEELSHSRNTTVTLGPNGQIFVLERASDRVVVFDGDGEFVRSFGGAGEGPGEFRSPMAMLWDGSSDRLWVADGLRGRYHAFDSTGAIQKTLRRPVYATRRIQHPLVRGPSGTIVDEAAGDNYTVLFLAVDTLGHLTDTLAKLPTLELSRGFRNVINLPSWKSMRFVGTHYIPRSRWSLARDGTVWSAVTGQLRLVQTSPDGDTLRIVETAHRTAEFDRRDLAMIAEGLAEAGIRRRDVELVRPVVSGIYLMDDGHILVGIIEQVGEDARTFDVFDPEGLFLGSIDLGFRLPYRNIPALVGDTIIAVTPGVFDVPYLVRATIVRPQ